MRLEGRDLIRAIDHPDCDPRMGLTTKQCDVLNLLIEHKTSKEISRLLGISPHTVDQRIMLARAKLQVATRSEVAQAYRRLLSTGHEMSDADIYQRSVYGLSHIASPAQLPQTDDREAIDNTAPVPLSGQSGQFATLPYSATFGQAGYGQAGSGQAAIGHSGEASDGYYHVLPKAFDGRSGTLLRLGAITAITVFLTLIILGGLAMYAQLSQMFDR